MDTREKLAALRAAMRSEGLGAYIIPSSDPHQSEIPPDHWRAREWISGFTGSAGTVVVTEARAGLWTDFRYYLQAEKQLAGSGMELFKSGESGVAEYPEWIGEQLATGDIAGFDGMCFSVAACESLNEALDGTGIVLRPTTDLLAPIWSDRPDLPDSEVREFDPRFAGESRGEKLSALRAAMKEVGARHHIVSTLDDIAWLLNIRGSDVAYVPVVVANLIVGVKSAELFIEPGKITTEVAAALETDGVVIRPYDGFLDAVGKLSGAVLISPTQISAAVAERLGEGVTPVRQLNLVTATKARKNATEIEHIRKAMIRDGVAMVRFLHWLSGAVASERVTEMGAAVRLEEFRMEGDRFVSPSFRSISAYRGHGALPHYSATADSDALLEPAGLYLIDSGGQYLDGTTDITRTISLGAPTEKESRDFTLVLKGHIALATLRFPDGTPGPLIDAICRQHLWREKMNYGHGTGHGVGFFLMVHEGPQRINQSTNDVKLEPGMLISNEPGVYRTGMHGVRIENLIVVRESDRSEFGQFLEFETVTLCPIDRTLIDTSLLTPEEILWVDDYHRRVRDRLLGLLDAEAAAWLEDACAPLVDRRIGAD